MPLTAIYAGLLENIPLEYEIGPSFFYSKYKEPSIMQTVGVMSGLSGSCVYTAKDRVKAKAEADLSFGQVEYKSRNTGTAHNENNVQFEQRVLLGYSVISDESVPPEMCYSVIPYLGIGYRCLNNDASDKVTTTGHRGYARESHYLYSPLGFEVNCRFEDKPGSRDGSIGLTCEYDHFWRGKQISRLSDADAGFNDIRNTQRKGYGFRGSIKLKSKGRKFDLLCEPFMRYWNIRKSRDANVYYAGTIWGYGWEPQNNTVEIGSRFVVTF